MTQLTDTISTTDGATSSKEGGDPIVRCAGLTKIFRDFWLRNRVKAVDGIDLEIRRGEVFGLLGPNGSGKSTTIKMILGLLHPTAGRIAVFGHHPSDVAIKQQIGYLPEETYLYRFLNARETLEYYGRLFHQHRRQRRQRIDMLLEMVGLDRVANRPIGEYSKGMQRRIGLAQALINDPQLLILDEPTTGMDPIGTRQIKDLLLELVRRGKTILLCSHLLADVEDVCDRVSIMFGGKVRREGTVEQLLVQEGLTDIQSPQLSEAELRQVEALLERLGKPMTRVQQPRQKLESLFLQIVHEAQAQGADTSGARAGGRIAQFLSEGGDTEGDAVIEQLTQTPEAEQDKETRRQGEEETRLAGAAQPPVLSREASDAVVEQLTQSTPPEPKTPSAPPGPHRSPASPPPEAKAHPLPRVGGLPALPGAESVDQDVLDALLGDADKDKPE